MDNGTVGSRNSSKVDSPAGTWAGPRTVGLAIVVLAATATIWAYWPTIVRLFKDWQADDNYSVCQLVPLVAVFLVWRKRKALGQCRIAPCWWGIGLILLAQAGRAYGLLFLYESAERYALVLTVVGLVLLIAGRQVFRRLAWMLLFLFLMVPLPGRIHNLISGPMQAAATAGAVFLLEAIGIAVSREGNVIVLNGSVPLAVAEACSGLRMLTAFVVVTAAMAFMVDRPRWQKAVLVISSVPIAIACNLLRLCVTAVLFLVASSEIAEKFFHDFAGLTMMPLAVFILLGELWLLARLVVPDAPAETAHAKAKGGRETSGRGGGKKSPHGAG